MKRLSFIFSLLIGFNLFIWSAVALQVNSVGLNLFFMDVGQGDSSLAMLPGGVKILIDGGADNREVLSELEKVLPPSARYIDLVILTHPELDHFGGLIDVLRRYRVGAFIYNGRDGTAEAWESLKNVLADRDIKIFTLREGDKISHASSRIDILSPDSVSLKSKKLNDTSLVAALHSEGAKILFTGDISSDIEDRLVDKYDLDIDVLKVAHHGSRFSSGNHFLRETSPLMASISSGKNNYGHPTPAAINRLSDSGSIVYRTDQEGTIHIIVQNGQIMAYSLK